MRTTIVGGTKSWIVEVRYTSEVKVLGLTVQMVKFASLPKSWSSKWKVQTSSTKVAKMSGTAKKNKKSRRSGAPSNP